MSEAKDMRKGLKKELREFYKSAPLERTKRAAPLVEEVAGQKPFHGKKRAIIPA